MFRETQNPGFFSPEYPGALKPSISEGKVNTRQVQYMAAQRRRIRLEGGYPDALDVNGNPTPSELTQNILPFTDGMFEDSPESRRKMADYRRNDAALHVLARLASSVATLRDLRDQGGAKGAVAGFELRLRCLVDRGVLGGSRGPVLGPDGMVEQIRIDQPANEA